MRCPDLTELPPPPPGKSGWPWTEGSSQTTNTMANDNPWPKVSIVTPSYNQGQFIEETIRSVLLQGYPNLEYIIIDGGSNDNSIEIIKKYEPWLTYWVSEPDRGQSHAINKGWERARGEIVAWINSDDTYNPDAIRRAIEALHANPDIGMVYSDMNYIDVKSKVIRLLRSRPYRFQDLLLDNYISQSTVFLRKTVLDEVGLLDETLHLIMDQEFWLRIGRRNKTLYLTDTVLANLRIYPETKSSHSKISRYTEGLQLLDKMFADQTLPKELKQLRRKEYGRAYIRLARTFEGQERYGEVMPWLIRAVIKYPSQVPYQWFLIIRLLVKRLLGISGVRSARSLRNLIRNMWHKSISQGGV